MKLSLVEEARTIEDAYVCECEAEIYHTGLVVISLTDLPQQFPVCITLEELEILTKTAQMYYRDR